MNKNVVIVALLFFSTCVLAEERSGTKICDVIIKQGESKKDMNQQESKSMAVCLDEVDSGVTKCQETFSKEIGKLDTGKKPGLIKMLEASKKLATCSTDVSIDVVKKYFK